MNLVYASRHRDALAPAEGLAPASPLFAALGGARHPAARRTSTSSMVLGCSPVAASARVAAGIHRTAAAESVRQHLFAPSAVGCRQLSEWFGHDDTYFQRAADRRSGGRGGFFLEAA